MVDLHDLRRLLSIARTADNGLIVSTGTDDFEKALLVSAEAWAAVEKLLDENLVCIGLGGEKFVFGSYDSIKACQAIVFGTKS